MMLWTLPLPKSSCETYSGCANTMPSTVSVFSLPKLLTLTLLSLSVVSCAFRPTRELSNLYVRLSGNCCSGGGGGAPGFVPAPPQATVSPADRTRQEALSIRGRKRRNG